MPLVGVVVVLLVIAALTTEAFASPSIPFEDVFRAAAKKWNVPFRLMVAIAAHESHFNPRAENEEAVADARRGRDVDSLGLMQVLFPDTALTYRPGLSREQLFDPVVNTDIGGQLLKDLMRRYPNPNSEGFHADAVAAYNAGSARFRSPGVYVNNAYVDAVYSQWRAFYA